MHISGRKENLNSGKYIREWSIRRNVSLRKVVGFITTKMYHVFTVTVIRDNCS